MPATDRTPRTLAQKLKWLRDLKAPKGEPPPSYEVTARQISAATGVSISGPYFWELATGRTTNPKLHHLQALAKYFSVPVGYLADDQADFHQLESELELLHTLKRGGVRDITIQGTQDTVADLPTIESLVGKLRTLNDLADDQTRDLAVRLTMLPPSTRKALDETLDDTDLLQALEIEHVRQLARTAAHLSPDHLTTLLTTATQPAL
ncbi:hypothetical protein D7231_34725, partial [Streptomyces klenkii]